MLSHIVLVHNGLLREGKGFTSSIYLIVSIGLAGFTQIIEFSCFTILMGLSFFNLLMGWMTGTSIVECSTAILAVVGTFGNLARLNLM